MVRKVKVVKTTTPARISLLGSFATSVLQEFVRLNFSPFSRRKGSKLSREALRRLLAVFCTD